MSIRHRPLRRAGAVTAVTAFTAFTAIAIASSLLASAPAWAAVSADEARQLGQSLTATGAEKAGNADAGIPAYTGGLTKPPADYKPGSGLRPDPYAGDKPLYAVDAKNLDQHAAKLTEGTRIVLKALPGFRLDVYPTHRSYPQPPQHVVDATAKNATECKATNNGLHVEGCWGGIPFPIPKTGYEALWNHFMHWQTPFLESDQVSWLVDASGNRIDVGRFDFYVDFPYYDPKQDPKAAGAYYQNLLAINVTPPRDAGNATLLWTSMRPFQDDSLVWAYTPGQRRVRRAPEFAYDTPIANYGGTVFYDEVSLYIGRMDRYDMKLVGKKDIIVPYNAYRFVDWTDYGKAMGPKFPDPSALRWELHRTWVVEATLKADKRHAMKTRRFYLDEDSWQILASESYDQADKPFRVAYALPTPHYEVPAYFGQQFLTFDFSKGSYIVGQVHGGTAGVKSVARKPAGFFKPEALAGRSVR